MNKKSASTFTTRASGIVLLPLVCLLAVTLSADAFVLPNNAAVTVVSSNRSSRRHFQLFVTSALAPNSSPDDIVATKKLQLKSQIRKEGGLFAFNTKFGALNPYAVWYGVTSIALGLFWFVALIGCELLYKVTNGRVDKLKRLPAFFSQIWGESLLKVALVTPEMWERTSSRLFTKGRFFFDVSVQVSLCRFLSRSHQLMILSSLHRTMYIALQQPSSDVCCQSQFVVGHSVYWTHYWVAKLQVGEQG